MNFIFSTDCLSSVSLSIVAFLAIFSQISFMYIFLLSVCPFKVPMKRKLSLGSYKIYPFKHAISKFEIARVKVVDFGSAQSWAISPSKMVFESRGQNAR